MKIYYGWVMAGTLAITETISWGIVYYVFTVMLTPMEAELGWTRTELTAGFSLGLLSMAMFAFPVGAWIDRRGPRLLMTAGSVGASVLVMAWSQVRDLPTYYLIWGLMGMCAAAILYEPAFAVMAKWFRERLGTALAIITFAAGLASTIFVPLAEALRAAMGWRGALEALAIFLALTTIPLHALVLRANPALPAADENGARAASVTVGRAMRERAFWVIVGAFTLVSVAAAAVRVHFIPLLTDGGISPGTAAVASGAIGLMQVMGRLVFAPMNGRYPGYAKIAVLFAIQAAATALLWPTPSLALIVLFVVFFGTVYGAETLARAAIIAELFGSASYGRISSVMSIFLTVGGTLAPVGAGALYDATRTYDGVVAIAVVLIAAALALVLWARPRTQALPVSAS